MRQHPGCRTFRMATEQHSPEILASGAGLAAAVGVEGGPELGEFEPVRARGYWEQVWLRFQRDKVAIGGGVFILLLFLGAFIGAPIAAHLLGHGPNDQFAGGVSQRTLLPVGPWTHFTNQPYPGAVGQFGHVFFILVGDGHDNITLGFLGKGVLTLVLVLGCFYWFYPARIVRAQVL